MPPNVRMLPSLNVCCDVFEFEGEVTQGGVAPSAALLKSVFAEEGRSGHWSCLCKRMTGTCLCPRLHWRQTKHALTDTQRIAHDSGGQTLQLT